MERYQRKISIKFGIVLILGFALIYLYNELGIASEWMSVIILYILMVVTVVYADATVKMVEDNTKYRRIRSLEQKLGKLYTPLILNWKFWELNYPEFLKLISDHPDYPPHSEAMKFLETIKYHAYLGSDELFSIIKEFHSICKKPNKLSLKKYKEFMDKFWNQLNDDFEKYQKELRELVGE